MKKKVKRYLTVDKAISDKSGYIEIFEYYNKRTGEYFRGTESQLKEFLKPSQPL